MIMSQTLAKMTRARQPEWEMDDSKQICAEGNEPNSGAPLL